MDYLNKINSLVTARDLGWEIGHVAETSMTIGDFEKIDNEENDPDDGWGICIVYEKTIPVGWIGLYNLTWSETERSEAISDHMSDLNLNMIICLFP